MPWPLSQDYNEAVQNPRTSFSDAELRDAEAVCNAMGIPIPRSGNFADVYEFRSASGGHWAVKCFTREMPGLRERYAAISRHLQQANLPFAVDFTFLEQGLRIGGRCYPILKMQWVEGLTLNEFVRKYADKPAMLQKLLQVWVRMATRLRESGIAHADLQHGNILFVTSGIANSLAVKLIDYDGMFVPALAGGNSGEVGHPCYQHPQRLAERTYSLEVDRFPLLLVATALEGLRVGGRAMWDKYDSGDNLLFREADLRSPVKSPLFYELLKLGDPRASRLASQTLDALKGRLESVPLLEEVLPELHAPPAPKPAAVPATPKHPTIVKAAVAQQTAVMPAINTTWDFEGEDKLRPRRRRKGGLLRWVWGTAAVGVAALVLAGGIFALVNRGETDNSPKPLPPRAGDYDRTGGYRLVHFGKDSTRVVLRFNDQKQKQYFARVCDQATGQPLTPPLKHESEMLHASFSPDGKRVVTASSDDTARLWDASTGKEVTPPLKHEGYVYHAAFSPDGRRVVTANRDNTARLWDAATGKEVVPPLKHEGYVYHAAFSPDGQRVVTASEDKTARVWDATSGKEVTPPLQHANRVLHASFSPDGRRVVTASADNTARLWDAASGKEVTSPLLHADRVNHVSFSPDGKRVVTVSKDRTARLWDTASGKEVTPPLKHEESVYHASFSPDGQRVVTASYDNTARLWDAATGKELNKTTIALAAVSVRPSDLSANTSVADLRQALKDNDPAVQATAAGLLAKLGPKAEPAIYDLADTLSNAKNPTKVRTLAALAIGHIGAAAKPVVPALVNALKRNEPLDVRRFAAEALAQMKYPVIDKAIPAVLDAIENDTDPLVRQKCVWSLFQMTDRDKFLACGADKTLTKLLDETAGNLTFARYDAARKLAHVLHADAPDKTVAVLLHMLRNNKVSIHKGTDVKVEGGRSEARTNASGDARYMGVEALGWLGPKAARNPDVVEALKEAAKDSDSNLSTRAQQLLKDFKIEIKEPSAKKEPPAWCPSSATRRKTRRWRSGLVLKPRRNRTKNYFPFSSGVVWPIGYTIPLHQWRPMKGRPSFRLTKEGSLMFYHTETKFQGWRALAIFEDGSECLLYVGRSTTQVRTGYVAAWAELLDAEERARVVRIVMQCWQGAADQGRWIAKADLSLPANRELASVA